MAFITKALDAGNYGHTFSYVRITKVDKLDTDTKEASFHLRIFKDKAAAQAGKASVHFGFAHFKGPAFDLFFGEAVKNDRKAAYEAIPEVALAWQAKSILERYQQQYGEYKRELVAFEAGMNYYKAQKEKQPDIQPPTAPVEPAKVPPLTDRQQLLVDNTWLPNDHGHWNIYLGIQHDK